MEQQKIVAIAMVCHQTNKAWCEANNDRSQKNWSEASQWQRDSAIAGVQFRLANPGVSYDAQHNAWMADKINDGWVYGPAKDADKKTHPCIVPFDQLPDFQQKKDSLFCAIVDALSGEEKTIAPDPAQTKAAVVHGAPVTAYLGMACVYVPNGADAAFKSINADSPKAAIVCGISPDGAISLQVFHDCHMAPEFRAAVPAITGGVTTSYWRYTDGGTTLPANF